ARSTGIFSPAPFADKTRQSQNDFGNPNPQAFGSRSLGECARARHTRFARSNRLDRGAGRSAAGETATVSDYSLLSDHGTCGASGVLRIPEAGARGFSPLVDRVASFLLFCRYDSGPRLFVARRIRPVRRHNSWEGSVAAPKRKRQGLHLVRLSPGQLRGVT